MGKYEINKLIVLHVYISTQVKPQYHDTECYLHVYLMTEKF